MTTREWIVSGIAGISVFLAVSLLAVRWAEHSAPGEPVEPARSPAPSSVPLAQSRTQPPEAAPAPAPPVSPEDARRPAPPAPISEQARALEPLRQEVFAGLASLDPRVEGCQLRDADLLLTLETTDGGVRVAEVQVAAAGAATSEATGMTPPALDEHAVRCVRRTLEQASFKAPSAVAGRRWELAYRPGSRP